MRGLVTDAAVTAETFGAEVIGENQNDVRLVWFLAGASAGSQSEETEPCSLESIFHGDFVLGFCSSQI